MIRVVLYSLLSIWLCGCALPPARTSVAMQSKFEMQEHEAYRQPGSANIYGQGFLRQKGGGTVTCAGNEVFLLPSTPFFREVVEIFKSGRKPELPPSVDASIARRGQCDAQGNFSFANLPSGAWLVATQVKWAVGYATQGGDLIREVRLGQSERLQVLLTEKDFVGR